MMLTLAIHCLLANILLGAATARYSFKCNGMPGVFYALLTLGGSVFWTLIGPLIALSLPFTENWCRVVIFFIWEFALFLPWGILCRNKYKLSSPWFFWIGFSGILTQSSFLAGLILMTVGEDLQKVLEYDISRYCSCLLLLFLVPAFILAALTFSFKKESWKCPDATLALASWACALFFFCTGLFSLKASV